MSQTKKVIIIAGPNGAGKTTFARSFLPAEAKLPRFINADLIAAGLSPFAPEAAAIKAGRLMLEEIAESVQHGESFALETTLSGLGYLRHIRQWQTKATPSACSFWHCPTSTWPSRGPPNVSARVATIFQRQSFGTVFRQAGRISSSITAMQ